jgi:sporulation protein YlmC with PRC-barrel domain
MKKEIDEQGAKQRMERAYREDELFGATIIDSEGYVYGKVEKIDIAEDQIVLLASEDKPDVRTVKDFQSLKEELLKSVKATIGLKLRRSTPSDILAENIKKELGLGVDEHLNNEHYVKYAERIGVSIPSAKASMERKEQKGTVNLNEIKNIKITVIGKETRTKTIKIILLHKPKEADFRRIPIQDKVPYRSTEAIRDKLVLDSEANAVGYVDSVVLFQGTPGIRVYVSKMSAQVNVRLLARYLEEIGQPDAATIVRKHLVGSKSDHYKVEMVDMDELEDFMRQRRISLRLPEKFMTSQSGRDFIADIPWDAVDKIGDVVLLKSTLTDLRTKGYI